MERKLATVRKVLSIESIPNADRIELITVDGWEVVVQKGLHKVGDLVIYCEIDSFLPIREEFEFLRKSSYRKMADDSEGFRLKTIRLRGQISQGLIMPLSILNEKGTNIVIHTAWEGMDVTDILGIQKYEAPIPPELEGEVVGTLPSFIQKTDEERIQNLTSKYPEWVDLKGFRHTEKLDGTSTTYYLNDGNFGVGGRNWEYKESETNTLWRLAREMKVEEKLRSLGENIAIQGECIGEGIQGNKYKIKGQTVRFFTVFLIDKYKKAGQGRFKHIMETLGLETVPLLGEIVLPEKVSDLLKLADAESVIGKTPREGIVIRHLTEPISFKVISNESLVDGD